MKKPSIDPLIKNHSEDIFPKQSSEAAKRALMKIPKEVLMELPEHAIVPQEAPNVVAAKKTGDALLRLEMHEFMYGVDKAQNLKARGRRAKKRKQELVNKLKKDAQESLIAEINLRELKAYAGRDPARDMRPLHRGTTKQLVGDSRESVLTKLEDYMIKNNEQQIIDSTDKAGEEFVNKLPEGTPLPTAKEQELLRKRPGGLFAPGPFDQDEEQGQDKVA